MNEIDLYLEKVSTGLAGIPDTDKDEIIGEIKNHIYEATNKQEAIQEVLQRLGNPTKLAKSYKSAYSLKNDKLKLSDVFSNIGFYISVAFSGIFVVPFLGITSVALVLSSILIMVGAVLNNLGVVDAPFNLGIIDVNGIWQIIMGIIISVVLCLIAMACWKGLKKYLAFVSSKYYEMRIGKRGRELIKPLNLLCLHHYFNCKY